jgi:hypothetical protein
MSLVHIVGIGLQVGLVQFDENMGGLTHIPKRYGFGALLLSMTG